LLHTLDRPTHVGGRTHCWLRVRREPRRRRPWSSAARRHSSQALRNIEGSLSAKGSKPYAMGFRSAIKRSALADANESHHWLIWPDLPALLIRRARKLYSGDALGVDLDNTVYGLDSSTIDLCPSLFEWAPFRSTNAAVALTKN
jgi:hypothetical protein